MTVYIFSEVRNLIKNSIPEEADEDIVIRALAANINARIQKQDKAALAKALILIAPDGMQINEIVETFLNTACGIALDNTKKDRLITNFKALAMEFYTSYLATIVGYSNNEKWKLKHREELIALTNDEKDEFIPGNLKNSLKKMIQL